MSALAVSGIFFGCICVGLFVGARLPGHQLADDTKDVVRLGTGLIATIGALVLGLLIASAKGSYDTKTGQIRQVTVDIILLDQLLEQYGPQTRPTRELLRNAVPPLVERIWREKNSAPTTTPFEASAAAEAAFAGLLRLSPQNDAQQALKARVIQIGTDLAQTRILLYTQSDSAIPTPFLAVLALWLTIIFGSFSLFVRSNATVVVALLVFALSASAAIFLILELSQPFYGLMAIPSDPLRHALAPLDA